MNAAPKVAVVDALWEGLFPLLTRFGRRIGDKVGPLITDVRQTATEVFPMTAYVSFLKDRQGDGMAVTISVRGDENVLVVDSDICMDDGTVLAEGPSVTFSLTKEPGKVDGLIDQWLKAFEAFLNDNEDNVVTAALTL